MTDTTGELIKKEQPIAAYDEFRAQLAVLKKENSLTVFNYEDTKGNKEARSHIYKLRQTKAAVERVRKGEKEGILERGRQIDSEAKEIIGEIDTMIDVHQARIDEIEALEKVRIEIIQANIDEMRTAADREFEITEYNIEVVADRLQEICNEVITEEQYAEFKEEAEHVKKTAILAMEKKLETMKQRLSDQQDLNRLRLAEQGRLQREQEERRRRQAEEEANRKAQEQIDTERRQREQAEREKQEAIDRAARIEKETEDRLKREAEEKRQREERETAQREADRKHRTRVNNAAVDALVTGGIDKESAKQAITLIAKGMIPAVKISY